MELEILKQNDPNEDEYSLKILLRNLKDLDQSLTKYLVQDFYSKEKITKKDVIDDIAKISNICNFILNKTQHKDYFPSFMEDKLNNAKNINNAWYSLRKIEEKLESYLDNLSIRTCFNPGFSFYSCNYALIEIIYRHKVSDYSIHSIPILVVSTHDGKKIEVKKGYWFYEYSNFSSDEYRKNINVLFTFDDIEKATQKITELALDFKENFNEKKGK